MKPRILMVPAQLGVLLELHLDKVLVEGAKALDDPCYIPEWGFLQPCRPGEMLKITIERVMPAAESLPLHEKATVA